MLKRILLLLVLVIVMAASYALHIPASWLASKQIPGLIVDTWGGTLINGQLKGRFANQPVFLAWHLHPEALLALRVELDVALRGPLDTDFTFAIKQGRLAATIPTVRLHPTFANWLGRLQITRWQGGPLVLERAASGAWLAARGRLSTPGGPMRVVLQQQLHDIDLPPSQVVLGVTGRDLNLVLRQLDGQPLGSVTLTADKRIEWQLRERLLRFKKGYTGQNNPDQVVLKVSEPL